MFKQEKGVTLVALVITIIVLLILAGVSIAMLTGDNGLLTKAKSTDAANKIGEAKENIAMTISELTADFYEKKYVNNDTTVTATSAGEYVKAQLLTKYEDGNKYATAANGTADGTVDITLVQKQDDGKSVIGTYTASTGNITWATSAE